MVKYIKLNGFFSSGYKSTITININEIIGFASSSDHPGKSYMYFGGHDLMITNQDRAKIEKILMSKDWTNRS